VAIKNLSFGDCKKAECCLLAPIEPISSYLVFWDERRDKGESGYNVDRNAKFSCSKKIKKL